MVSIALLTSEPGPTRSPSSFRGSPPSGARAVSAEVGYQRRWLGNFVFTDNLAITPADMRMFGVNVPSDPRLPNGGGYVLEGLSNATSEAASRPTKNIQTLLTRDYGDQSQISNQFNFNVTARPRLA